ncbi:MAG: hypothetical protein KDC99_15445 [Cyclobacteriaceae bacterium]|nr:hypothetical protein [Cyclobacteriaceae bacterium]
MDEKIKMLELASCKAAADSGFIAYLVNKYLEVENISEQEILSALHCSEEDYFKLKLCRVPDVNATDFVSRLNRISEYTNSSSVELNKIIKRANSILRLSGDNVEQHNYLMAARDKQNKEKK